MLNSLFESPEAMAALLLGGCLASILLGLLLLAYAFASYRRHPSQGALAWLTIARLEPELERQRHLRGWDRRHNGVAYAGWRGVVDGKPIWKGPDRSGEVRFEGDVPAMTPYEVMRSKGYAANAEGNFVPLAQVIGNGGPE